MPSAKQIAWRKKFARMVKSGKFRKSKRKPLWLKGSQASKMTDAQIIAKSKKSNLHPITGKKRMTRNELEQKELENLNRDIPQFEMVNLGKQSQKILDSMKKRRDILSKKY
jgi:hypothetical protein